MKSLHVSAFAVLRLLPFAALLLALSLAVVAEAQPALLPEIRLVAGRADTLVLADLSPTASLALQSAGPVAAEMLGDRVVLTPSADAEGVFLVPALLDGDEAALMVRVTRLIEHVFRYDAGDARPEAVFVIGEFNGWSRTSHPLADPDGDGVYEREVQIRARPLRVQVHRRQRRGDGRGEPGPCAERLRRLQQRAHRRAEA